LENLEENGYDIKWNDNIKNKYRYNFYN
jgi:hypothetical protein